MQGLLNLAVRFTKIASAKSDGSCVVEERVAPGGPPPTGTPSRLFAPFGIRSVPPAGVDACELRAWGSPRGSMTVGYDSTQYGPSDLQEGEAAIYSKSNPRAVVATGPDVVVNQGTAAVGRVGDAITRGVLTLTAVLSLDGSAIVGLTMIYTPGDGTAPQTAAVSLLSPGPAILTLHENIGHGADHFKA